MGELPLNQILCGDCRDVMAGFPEDNIDLVVTSPPYWGLRDYGGDSQIWGGDPGCDHEWGDIVETKNNYRQGVGGKLTNSKEYLESRLEAGSVSSHSEFCIKCGAWSGQLGLEPNPQMFIDHLVEICREVKRVLKPSGTFWLNLGDTYYGSGKGAGGDGSAKERYVPLENPIKQNIRSNWLQPKQKLMMPSRVAIALQDDGWILRSDIIWHKPNHMPSSVKDRLTCAYEHVFLFAKARRYYFDLDAIRQQSASTIQRIPQPNVMNQPGGDKQRELRGEGGGNASRSADMVKSLARNYEESGSKYLEQEHPHSIRIKGGHTGDYTHPRGKNPGDIWEVKEEKLTKHDIAVGRIGNFSYTDPLHVKEYHPRGKNPGDLWRIPTTPFPGAHFATFPPKLIEPIIKAGCPRWICSRCGKPRTRIIKTEKVEEEDDSTRKKRPRINAMRAVPEKGWQSLHHTIGWSDCGCGADWVGGVVLDPFAGSGTALRVARKLGRRFIGIEVKPEYAEMCESRVKSDSYNPAPDNTTTLREFFDGS